MRIIREQLEPGKGTIEMYKDVAMKWRFRVKANNHKIIAISEGYNSRQACLNGIRSLIRTTGDVEIIEV